MLSPEHLALLLRHRDAENAHKMRETLDTLTKDCVFDDRAMNRVFHGHKGAEEYYRMWWEAFAIVAHTEKRFFPSPDIAIVETRFKGKHVGPFMGVAPTGREVDVPIAIIVEMKDGLMTGERFYYDRGTLMKQIGAA